MSHIINIPNTNITKDTIQDITQDNLDKKIKHPEKYIYPEVSKILIPY